MIRDSLNISHYEVLGKIGVGGMGTVYKARDPRLHRLVAIKCLNQSEKGRDRFLREARATSGLDHPNICTIYEVGESDDGEPFIAMAFYSGGTLKRRMEHGPLSLPEALDIATQIARGLDYASRSRIVHRDIKPGNIMFSEHGTAKIVDFGIAKVPGKEALTLPGRPMGTMHYMAPEQVEGQPVTLQADIWALGVVLFEMLTATLPFPGTEHQQVFSAILLHDPPSLKTLNPRVPDLLEDLIVRALAKDPADRYANFSPFLADLAEVRASLSTGSGGMYMPGLAPAVEQGTEPTRAAEDEPVGPISEEMLELPEGSMDPQSPYYVRRWGDELLRKKIKAHQGITFSIVGPRQIGKSSMLLSVRDWAVDLGRQVAFVDLQIFGRAALKDADAFYRQFCALVSDELDLDDDTERYWNLALSNNLRCTRYFSRYLLKKIDKPLLLAMDEVDCLVGTDYGSDFFGMLRSWHNSRRAGSIWKNLDLGLVTSTEPYFLIAHQEQSPFNVGETVELEDFDRAQAEDLNQRHGHALRDAELEEVHQLTGGHPYLLRKALYVIASGEYTFGELLDQAIDENGPFGEHLRNYLYKLYGQTDLVAGMASLVNGKAIDDWTGVRLKGVGLARRDHGSFIPRCLLYQRFFAERLEAKAGG